MLLERAELIIKEGLEEEFAAAMSGPGLDIVNAFPGAKSVRLGRGVENPGKFMLLIEWETLDAHTAFTQAPIFADFRAIIAPYSVGGSMEHFEIG